MEFIGQVGVVGPRISFFELESKFPQIPQVSDRYLEPRITWMKSPPEYLSSIPKRVLHFTVISFPFFLILHVSKLDYEIDYF